MIQWIVNELTYWNIDCMSVVFGFFGSMMLIGDVTKLKTKRIVNEAGTYDMIDRDNCIRKQVETLYNTMGAGLLLFISYLLAMAKSFFNIMPNESTIQVSGLLALMIAVIVWVMAYLGKEWIIKKAIKI